MKKTVTLILLIPAMIIGALGQNNNVGPFEFEIGLGAVQIFKTKLASAGNIKSKTPSIGSIISFESRYNIGKTSLDGSIYISLTDFDRTWENHERRSYDMNIVAIIVDRNFRYWKNFAPFIGIGYGGMSSSTSITSEANPRKFESYSRNEYDLFFMPRVGVELFDHLRVTLDLKFMRHSEFTHYGLTIGYAIGGGRRRAQKTIEYTPTENQTIQFSSK